MTGIAGGTVDGSRLGRMVEAFNEEPWYDSDRFEAGSFALATRHHGDRDPGGYGFWSDGRTAGVVDGAITNLDELGWGLGTVFERLLRSPERTLSALEGPFCLACVDADDDRLLVGTDKIGCRPCYYATDGGLVFSSRLAALVPALDAPTVDVQGVSDMLLMGNMWSDTTLLEEASALHPATVLEYSDGELSRWRYWEPDYEPAAPTDQYFYDLLSTFERAVERTATSTAGDVGLWLSGGLDSRATASALADHRDEFDEFRTFTYDANPGGGVNPRLAADVADALSVPNETVPLSPDHFLSALETAVDVTDGMVRFDTLFNLSAAFNVGDPPPDVLMEGLEGALVGHHLCKHHLNASTLVESMYESEAATSAATVESLLDVPVDPLGSFRREARRVDEPSVAQGAVDAHFQNYYARLAHASNPVPRAQAGTRVPYADGDFLEHVARLPRAWRMGAVPFSDGKLIYGVVKPKMRLIRALDTDLAEIPYERSRLKPTRPYPLHVVGFFASTAAAQLAARPTYGPGSRLGRWYRSHDAFRRRIDDLLDAACRRRFLDADAIRARRERHLDGERDEMTVLSAVATLELWFGRHLD